MNIEYGGNGLTAITPIFFNIMQQWKLWNIEVLVWVRLRGQKETKINLQYTTNTTGTTNLLMNTAVN